MSEFLLLYMLLSVLYDISKYQYGSNWLYMYNICQLI